MNVDRNTIVLKTRGDVTKDFLAQVQSKGSCAGTFQKVGECEYPCIDSGLLVKSYEQTSYTSTHAEFEEAMGIVKSLRVKSAEQMEFGQENPNASRETVICRPLTVMTCPCTMQAKINEYDHSILKDLGVENIPKLYPQQMRPRDLFKAKKVSLFIYGDSGSGKTILAAACALGYHRKVKVMVGDEIAAEWRRKAFDNVPLDYSGLLILDDLDKIVATDSFKEKLWYILDRVVKNKLRLIITTNLAPRAFAEKYTAGKDEAESMISRIEKFEVVGL